MFRLFTSHHQAEELKDFHKRVFYLYFNIQMLRSTEFSSVILGVTKLAKCCVYTSNSIFLKLNGNVIILLRESKCVIIL
jgi:hypothetical protein